MILTNNALNRTFLARQMLLQREKVTALDAIERLVGLQAQRTQPPLVGLWTRIEAFREAEMAGLLKRRAVIRATTMRGTLHYLSARQYLKFRSTLQPALSAGAQSILGERTAGLDIPALLKEARLLLTEQPRTFAELRAALQGQFPDANERVMGYLIRMHLPLAAVPEDDRFALAQAWLGEACIEDEDLPGFIKAYLAAFGPATAADMQAWSGLAKLKNAFEGLRPELRILRDEQKRELFDTPDAPLVGGDVPAPVRYLPAFDNLILSHANRSRIIAEEHRPRVVSKNLQVAPTFLVDGFVAGIWDVEVKKKTATLTLTPFGKLAKDARRQLLEEGEKLVAFLAPEAAGSVKVA